jgi:hypothetical protein
MYADLHVYVVGHCHEWQHTLHAFLAQQMAVYNPHAAGEYAMGGSLITLIDFGSSMTMPTRMVALDSTTCA